MTPLAAILRDAGVDYTVCPGDRGEIILLVFPYAPYEPYPEGHLFLDSYFLTSHFSYGVTNKIIQELGNAGLAASRYRGEPLKELAVRSGRAKKCKNDLVYTEEYGSYIYLDAVKIEGAGNGGKKERSFAGRTEAENKMEDCDACIRACPGGALSENGFERGKCIRQFMDKKYEPTEKERAMIGDRLLGCAECRAVCPKNAHIQPVPIPEEVLAATQKDRIDYRKLKILIGGNLLKKR